MRAAANTHQENLDYAKAEILPNAPRYRASAELGCDGIVFVAVI
jgi:hypothetical protein